MTRYVLEFFEKGERDPIYRSLCELTSGHHPHRTDEDGCFDGKIQRALTTGGIHKVRLRYESNMNLAAEAKMGPDGVGILKWFRR